MNIFPTPQAKFQPAAITPPRRIAVVFFLLALLALSPRSASAQLLTPAWVELGPDGAALLRVIVNAPTDCPAARIDGANVPMTVRQPTPPGFRPACEVAIPAAAKSVSVNGQALVLPQADPTRIVAFGDTGCRIKDAKPPAKPQVQDCNDPSAWPFEQIASQAASEKPQLMIHVGDYLYRESPCPDDSKNFCANTPDGDNWASWDADFFKPAAKLLAAVPWAFSRGNHEDCTRSWRGWFYYLDPRPWSGMCEKYSPPYLIKLGGFQLAMFDSSPTSELVADEDQVTDYVGQLVSLRPQNAWLVDHHPFWGYSPTAGGLPPVPISAPLEEAWNRANPKGYSLILSGHIHLFEFVSVAGAARPDQVVIGDGGTSMSAPISIPLKGAPLRGAVTAGADTEHEFGYALFTKTDAAWQVVLKNRTGKALVSCNIPGGSIPCQSAASN
jgi:calcineurin-like phosphoesterase family protein